MIDIGAPAWNFACDECGICMQIENRMRVAEETETEFQFDHCSCDKIDAEFFIGGYCEDAFTDKSLPHHKGKRKTGRAFRRKMRKKHLQKYRDRHKFIRIYGAPYPNYKHVDGENVMVGSYIIYPRSSANKVFFKRVSNKKVRRYNGYLWKGNEYRKFFDYWWTLY